MYVCMYICIYVSSHLTVSGSQHEHDGLGVAPPHPGQIGVHALRVIALQTDLIA
jgi:hypothetical protein